MKKTNMRLTKRVFLPAAFLLLTIATLQQGCNGGSGASGYGDKGSAIVPDSNCINAPASWFASATTPEPDNYGPFVDTATTTDCDFHLWAWQKFLSLTRSASNKSPFENLVQVDNDLNKRDNNILILTDSSQAASRGVLYDKTNRATFYAIFVNKQMYDFQKKYLPLFKQYLMNLPEQHLDTLNYPVGCLELKTSWILTSSLKADSVNYYITNAKLVTTKTDTLRTTNKNLIVIKTDTIKTRVALLGMHVIGRVASHPELIWSTFEHDSLVPNYDWAKMNRDTTNAVVSNKDYVFYNKGTTVKNCPMTNDSIIPKTPGFSNAFNIYTYGMAQLFTDTVKFTAPSHADSADNVNIVAINKSVHTYLEKESSPWKHYFYKGAIWLHNPDTTNFGPGNSNIYFLTNTALRGSRAVSNITMETFTQLDYSGIYKFGSLSCFGCHATVDFKNTSDTNGVAYNLALSHLFINALLHQRNPKAPPTP